MSKVWVGFALAAAAIVGGAAYVAMSSNVPDLGPAGPNRDLAPDTLAVYAEFPDVAGTWAKLAKTESWQDLSGSKIAERFLAAERVKDFLAALDQVSTKAAYPVNAKNAMKFIGRECSVGLALDAAGGVPNVLVLTKLDVDALSHDFLGGKVNLDALWGELQRRTGKCDFTVVATDHRGHKIATATRGATAFHAALVGDTLAVSTDAALVRAAIDCRLSAGAHSIGKKAAFVADVKQLPAGTAGFEWYDLDALDAGRTSVDAGLESLGTPPAGVAAVHALLDGTRGAHSVALSEILPDGDLYRATWTFSKSSDLFADKATPSLRSLFGGDWLVYGELHDAGGVAAAYERSALAKKLGQGEVGKWWRGVLDDPAPALGKIVAELGGLDRAGKAPSRRRAAGAPPDVGGTDPEPDRRGHRAAGAPPPVPETDTETDPPPAAVAGAVDEGLAMVDTFVARMGRHLASDQMKAIVNGEAACGFDWTGKEGETPRFACAIQLDVEGRLLVMAAQAAAMEADDHHLVFEQVGARRVYCVDIGSTTVLGSKKYWTLAGDVLLVSNDHDLALAGARTSDAAPKPAAKAVEDALLTVKAGWKGFLRLDFDRLRQSLTAAADSQPAMHEFAKALDLQKELGQLGRDLVVAAYVPDDFASVEVVARTSLAAPMSDEGRALRDACTDREPLCWASLPDTTIGAMVANVPAAWIAVRSVLGAGLADVTTSFREKMGMDLEKELMPALGRELSLAVTFRAAPASAALAPGQQPTLIPGILLGVEVRDAALVRRAIDRALQLAEEQLHDQFESTKPFVREAHDGVEIVRMQFPPEQEGQVPFRPAMALHAGYLLVSSDVDVLRAAVDAKNGKGPRFADSPVFARATKVLARKCAQFQILDWSRLADQVAEYAPQMGGLFATAEVKFPEPPDDGNQEEWQRRIGQFQKDQVAARAAGVPKARAWIDSFRVIDFAGASVRVVGNASETTMVLKFAE